MLCFRQQDKMVFECLTWITFIWDQLLSPFIKKRPIRPLPDDLTIEILSRLPITCILECRRVCRKWRSLTSAPYFAELHLQRDTAPPSLFFHWCDYSCYGKVEDSSCWVYDKAGHSETINRWKRKRRTITRVISDYYLYHSKAIVLGSCNGLLMFRASRWGYKIFVFNPIIQKILTLPSLYEFTTPCGIYFYPLTGDYKLLLRLYTNKNCHPCYYTYSLKSKVCKNLDYCSSCRTRSNSAAIMLNGSLHWMVYCNKIKDNKGPFNHTCPDGITFNHTCPDGIILFDTKTEVFRVLPLPGDICCNNPTEHGNMHLLGTRDHLCICHVSWGEVIHVWVLKDYVRWAWDRRYKINLNWDLKRFPFEGNFGNTVPYRPRYVRPLGINTEELVISWDFRGVFTCNLKQNIVSKIPIKANERSDLVPYASAYTRSLITWWFDDMDHLDLDHFDVLLDAAPNYVLELVNIEAVM
ncbi:hypothetical protein LguiA_026644 [Lonicera macranthoides]